MTTEERSSVVAVAGYCCGAAARVGTEKNGMGNRMRRTSRLESANAELAPLSSWKGTHKRQHNYVITIRRHPILHARPQVCRSSLPYCHSDTRDSKNEGSVCHINYSKSKLHKQVSETGKSDEHQRGHCNPSGRVPITELLGANFVRSG